MIAEDSLGKQEADAGARFIAAVALKASAARSNCAITVRSSHRRVILLEVASNVRM
jgi:hypothetical protein